MKTGISERRRSTRMPAAYPVTLYTRRGRLLARGRTANISENGIHLITDNLSLRPGKQVCVSITLPAPAPRGERIATRNVVYLAEIVRCEQVAQLLGVGIQFIQKQK